MGKKQAFYVTTPIYYPSGNLHIGHAYTTTLADILARYKKEKGYEVFFLTGSDEHGLKIQQKAEEAGVDPKTYVDGIVENFKELWSKLNISYDRFIRTTDEDHVNAVKNIFSLLLKKDLIYPSTYKGKYCVSCEEFLTQEQMNDNFEHVVCQKKAIDFEEETYMLRVSQFKNFLVEIFNTDFLEPKERRNEMLNNFVLNDLEDLSVTRVSFDWGIKVNENKKHIIYVWLDALSNYITALGFQTPNKKLLNKFWSEDTEIVQLVGKEITRFHSIYWPVILKSLDLRLPNKLLSHGWILNKDAKMSKSIGNVVSPIELINKYSSDALRFYIAACLPMERDGNYSEELFEEAYNINLANNIGNLISRTSKMIMKYFDGVLQNASINYSSNIVGSSRYAIEKYCSLMDQYNIYEAVQVTLKLGQEVNKLIETTKPWELEKNNDIEKLKQFLCDIRHVIVVINYLLKPILTEKYNLMQRQLGCDPSKINFNNLLTDDINFDKINSKDILFERLK